MTDKKIFRGCVESVGMSPNNIEIRFSVDNGGGSLTSGVLKMSYEEAAVWENVQQALQKLWDTRPRYTEAQEQIKKALLARIFTLDDNPAPEAAPK